MRMGRKLDGRIAGERGPGRFAHEREQLGVLIHPAAFVSEEQSGNRMRHDGA